METLIDRYNFPHEAQGFRHSSDEHDKKTFKA